MIHHGYLFGKYAAIHSVHYWPLGLDQEVLKPIFSALAKTIEGRVRQVLHELQEI